MMTYDDITDGKSDYYSYIYSNYLLLTSFFLIRFQVGSQSLNLSKQPLTVPERFIKDRYLRLKGCVIDAEEEEDSNQLLFSSI